MKTKTSRSIAALCLLTAGGLCMAVPAQAQVTVEITGQHGLSEGACTLISSQFFGWDCTYGGTNTKATTPTEGELAGQTFWSGPTLGGTYYEAGSAGDSTAHTPTIGDGKIHPTVTGSLTITGEGEEATVEGTIVIGPAVRNIATSQSARAVEGWSSITHTLEATPVSSAVANDDGGYDYVIGSLGAPELLCIAGTEICFGENEEGADTVAGPNGFWGVGGVAGVKPTVGIEAAEPLAGATATIEGVDRRNIGASTDAVVADPVCASTAPADCDSSTILWTATTNQGAGYDNLILVFSTDGNGNITSGRAYWTQEYNITLGPGSAGKLNSNQSGTFTFTGSTGPVGPSCANLTQNVLENSGATGIDVIAQCTGFTGEITEITIVDVDPADKGTAVVDEATNQIVFTPALDATGPVQITYSATDGTDTEEGILTVNIEEDIDPVGVDGDFSVSTQGVEPETVTATLNLSTLEGINFGNEPTTITISTPATNGTAAVNAGTKIVTYTPNAGVYVDTDTFNYTLTDNDGGIATGTITVTIVDVDPVIQDAVLTTSLNEEGTVTLSFTPGNGSAASHTLEVTGQAESGTCEVGGVFGQIVYTPNADFIGEDSCEVTLTDANGDPDTATINITVSDTNIIVIDGGSSAVDPASLAILGGLPLLLRRRRKALAAAAVTAAAGVLAAPAAMAQDSWDWNSYDGLYIGAGVIGTSIESDSGLNRTLSERLSAEVNGDFEDFPVGGQIFVGWMFNQYWGLEARWSDSGDGDSDFKLDGGEGGNIGDIEIALDGWTIYAVGNWPVAPRWDIFGKIGYTDQTGDFDYDIDGSGNRWSDDDNGFAAALGARWRFARHWAATLEGEYLGVNFDDAIKEPWRVGLNVEYWFGGKERAVPVAAAPVAAPVVAAPPPPPAAPVCADEDGDGVCGPADLCPDTPRGEKVGPNGCSCDVTRQLTFGFDSAKLSAGDKAILDEMAETLTRLNFVEGVIEGYTDSVGAESYNLALSQRRAQAAADYLQSKGIAASRMKVIGRGEADPIGDNSTAEGRAQNRRVVARRTDCN